MFRPDLNMNFRTLINIEPSRSVITYNDKVMFTGSCFAAYMGDRMKLCKMPVMINPSGTVFNPISVLYTLNSLISFKASTENDLFFNEGNWISFNHYTDFSSEDSGLLIQKINDTNFRAGEFLKKAGFLFITFGSSRVYRFKETGSIVSNCHKVPGSKFENELLTVDEIVKPWFDLLDRISIFNPDLKIIFTISPVRHWKDGAHGNQVSKSVLFLAIEELLRHESGPEYFPAYELQMDDLRDYRFYADDMLHPSSAAIEYIWSKFSESYFDKSTKNLQSQIQKVTKATGHKFLTDSQSSKMIFADNMLNFISKIEEQSSIVDFFSEKEYFRNLKSR